MDEFKTAELELIKDYGEFKGKFMASCCEDIIEHIVVLRESTRLCASKIGISKSSVYGYIDKYIKKYYTESYKLVKRQLQDNKRRLCNVCSKRKS